jgi:hypothetical protein
MPNSLMKSAGSCSKYQSNALCCSACLVSSTKSWIENGDIHFAREAQFDETMFPFFGSRRGKFIHDDEICMTERGQGPEHLQNTIQMMMTKFQATTQMGLMMPSTTTRTVPTGYEHHLQLLQTLHHQQELVMTTTTIMMMRCSFLRLLLLMRIRGEENTAQTSTEPQRIQKPVDRHTHVHLATAKVST